MIEVEKQDKKEEKNHNKCKKYLLMSGSSESSTVTIKEQAAVFAPSVAEYVTLVAPRANCAPEEWPDRRETAGGPQLSVALGAEYVVAVEHVERVVFNTWLEGHTITGASWSVTFRDTVHVAMLLEVSVAVTVTVAVPGLNGPQLNGRGNISMIFSLRQNSHVHVIFTFLKSHDIKPLPSISIHVSHIV